MTKDTNREISVECVPIRDLKPDPLNPRKHSERQIRQIAQSIKTFGFSVPILIDRNKNVLAGHGRLLASQRLGRRDVPAIRLDLTEAEARAFMIADNRLAELATWDDRLLAGHLNDLSMLNLNFNIEATGFTIGEIDLRIEGLTAVPEGGADPADQLPEPTDQSPVSNPGDLWQLGRHSLHCGNALEAASYHALLRGARAHMVFTDPPYNVRIHGHASGHGAIRHREFAMAAGEMDRVEFTSFLTRSCSLMARHSVDGAMHFVCMDWRHMSELLEAGMLAYTDLKNVCVWVKDNGGMGSLYRSQHELVFVFKHGSVPHRNNVQLGQYGRNRTNVWHYPCANTLSRQSDEGRLAALHPTIKPVALVADAILDCSARGDVVLDPFLGSGTTLIAAERVGRVCYGMELDRLYVDTAIRRWQAYGGEKATHVATSKRFDDIATEAEGRHDR